MVGIYVRLVVSLISIITISVQANNVKITDHTLLQQKIEMLESQLSVLQSKLQNMEGMLLKPLSKVERVFNNTAESSLHKQDAQASIQSEQSAKATQAVQGVDSRIHGTESGLYEKITRLIEGKDYKKAETLAQKYIQIFSEEKNAAAVYFWLGEIKMLFGDLVPAKSYYEKSLGLQESGERAPEILLKIAVICYQSGNTAEGDQHYHQLEKLYPGSTALHMAKAQRSKYRVEQNQQKL